MSKANETDDPRLLQVQQILSFLYPDQPVDSLFAQIDECMRGTAYENRPAMPMRLNYWSAKDAFLITYGDSLVREGEVPLRTLEQFLEQELGETVSIVHILPFSPYSSDDGFAVIDYMQINPDLGTWDDVNRISEKYRIMGDLVINHISSQSEWFQNFCEGKTPGAEFFIEASEEADLSQVVRPRASPLLRPTQTPEGMKYVWCTFSHDQIDLNFANPAVLVEFLKVIRHYLDNQVSVFRLDAIGYLWKQEGTNCIHLPQTHAMVRLMRLLLDHYAPGSLLITETNVPNHENLSYFGNRNEAHLIYNFSLAPLLLHALLTGQVQYLKRWMMSMPPAPMGCTYLNFTASHDGIGMRPVEGLLSDHEQFEFIQAMHRFGARVSTRRNSDGSEKVYEVNISLFDACQGSVNGPDAYQRDRFLCSQTVMMSLEGIPAFYIHSLLATPNDNEKLERTQHNRSINRHQWNAEELQQKLADPDSDQSVILKEIQRRMELRKKQPAFHPNAIQFTLQLDEPFFSFWRQSLDREQSIFCINNMSDQPAELSMSELNLISTNQWFDLLSGERIDDFQQTIHVKPYQSLWLTNYEA